MSQRMLEVLISSSVLIGALAVLRLLLRGKISPRLQYGLWLLVVARLLVPISIGSSAASVMNYVPQSTVQTVLEDASAPAQRLTVKPALSAQNAQKPSDATLSENITSETAQEEQTAEPSGQETPAARRSLTHLEVLYLIWGAGAALVLLFILVQNLRLSRKLRRSRVQLDGVEGKLPVYITEELPSACLFGLLHPAIYLTPQALNADGTPNRYVLLHEQTHYDRRDHSWCAVRLLCMALYWFDPFVWLAARLSKIDGELACDEAVLKNLDEPARIAYGRTLLDQFSGKRSAVQAAACATTMVSGKRTLRTRIRLIAKKPKMTIVTLALVIGVCLLLAACTFTNRKTAQSSGPDLPDLIQVDGTCYQLTDDLLTQEEASRVQLAGTIKSYVDYTQLPSKDDQANFLAKGREYGDLDGQLVIKNSLDQWVYTLVNLPGDTVDAAVLNYMAPDVAEICGYQRCRTGSLVTAKLTNSDGTLDVLLLFVQKQDGETKVTQAAAGRFDDTLGYGVYQTQIAGQRVVFGLADRRMQETKSGSAVSVNFTGVTLHTAAESTGSALSAAPGETFAVGTYDTAADVTSVRLTLGEQGDVVVFTEIPSPEDGAQAVMTLGENWSDAAEESAGPALSEEEQQAIRQAVFEKFSTAQWDWDTLTEEEINTFTGADARKNGMSGNYPNYYSAFADYFIMQGKAPSEDEIWSLSLPKQNLLALTIGQYGEPVQKLYYALETGTLCGLWQQPLLETDTPVGVGVTTDYADEDILVFHGYFGLFVYDLRESKMLFAIDLGAATGTTNIQGGYGNAVSVWKDSDAVKITLSYYDYERFGLSMLSYNYDASTGRLSFAPSTYSAGSMSFEETPASKVELTSNYVRDLTYSDGIKTWKLFGNWSFGKQTDAVIVPLTMPETTASAVTADDFFDLFWELDRESMQAYLDAHPESLSNGWVGIDINESGFDRSGTSIRTTMGEQVLAINYREQVLLVRVEGEKYRGVLAVAKDPARLSVEMSNAIGSYGQLAGEIAEAHGGLLAMTCNGFLDPGGQGNGGEIAGYAMSDGVSYGAHYPYSDAWPYARFEILTDNTVRIRRSDEPVSADCRDATEFDPALIVDGEVLHSEYWTSENPRACIGQSDRQEMLMMVIEGRMPEEDILGTSVNECAAILARHGAVQAMNVDGGTSAILWYDGQYVTRCSNPQIRYTGGRALPNAFVYHREGN